MTESERLTFETELGISIDKNEDCPTMSICWNCDIKVKDCKYFNDVVEKLAKYEAIGTIEEFKDLKEKNTKKRFNIFESHGMRQFVCGYCDRPILTTDNYCSFCGQKLDWQ